MFDGCAYVRKVSHKFKSVRACVCVCSVISTVLHFHLFACIFSALSHHKVKLYMSVYVWDERQQHNF